MAIVAQCLEFLDKPLTTRTLTSGTTWTCNTGINYTERFIIAVRDTGTSTITDAIPSNLVGLSGAILAANIQIYELRLINCTHLSTIFGTTGLHPDAAVPRVDLHYGETRNAFPLSLAANTTRAIVVEVYVPLGTVPGTYSGTISLTGAQPITINYSATVKNATIPSTSSMKTAFAIGYSELNPGHNFTGVNDTPANTRMLMDIYTKELLMCRFSNSELVVYSPAVSGGSINWAESDPNHNFDAIAGPFLNGTVSLPGGRLPGAKLTTIRMKDYGHKYYPTTGTVTLSGSSGTVNSISVNGVVVTNGAVPFSTNLMTTAANLAASINAKTSTPDYTAISIGATVYIRALSAASPSPVGYAVTGSLITLTATYTAMAADDGTIRTQGSQNDQAAYIQYCQDYANHFRAVYGGLDRLFNYMGDEPHVATPTEWPVLSILSTAIHAGDAGLKTMVTVDIQDATTMGVVSAIDIFAPTFRFMYDKPSGTAIGQGGNPALTGPQFDKYLSKEQWWYAACNTHGCGIVGGDPVDDPPQYNTKWQATMADLPWYYSRLLEWMTYVYQVRGENYYDTVYAYDKRDPWGTDGIYETFGGNGDGTLFYPGTPAKIGGTHHIPIKSAPLMHMHQAQQEYELFLIVEARFGRPTALALAAPVITNPYTWSEDITVINNARQALLSKAAEPLAPPPPTLYPAPSFNNLKAYFAWSWFQYAGTSLNGSTALYLISKGGTPANPTPEKVYLYIVDDGGANINQLRCYVGRSTEATSYRTASNVVIDNVWMFAASAFNDAGGYDSAGAPVAGGRMRFWIGTTPSTVVEITATAITEGAGNDIFNDDLGDLILGSRSADNLRALNGAMGPSGVQGHIPATLAEVQAIANQNWPIISGGMGWAILGVTNPEQYVSVR